MENFICLKGRVCVGPVNKLMVALGISVLLFALSILFADKASAHGYVENSRADLCAKGINTDCGYVKYNPADLEAPGGFPTGGPEDGKIASANGRYPEMDQQWMNRWEKIDIASGLNTFTWVHTANHNTANWRYYITKPDWNPNQPLTRASFDTLPFCSVSHDGTLPEFKDDHLCNVPSDRSGYHVILAVWEVAYTGSTFYQVIDVNIDGDTDPGNGGNPGPGEGPENPGECGYLAWSSSQVYNFGDVVSFNGGHWKARWYTQGQEPGTAGEWGAWEYLGECASVGGHQHHQ